MKSLIFHPFDFKKMHRTSPFFVYFGENYFIPHACTCPLETRKNDQGTCYKCTKCCICGRPMNDPHVRNVLAMGSGNCLSVHQDCKKCEVCSEERSFEQNKDGAHITCSCNMRCVFCNKPFSSRLLPTFTITAGVEMAQHENCYPEGRQPICYTCGFSQAKDRRNPLVKMDTGEYKHTYCGGFKCRECKLEVHPNDQIKCKQSSGLGYKLLHKECASRQICRRCEKPITDGDMIFQNGFYEHHDFYCERTCYICSKSLSKTVCVIRKTTDGDNFHEDCAKVLSCVVCREPLTLSGRNVIGIGNHQLRHADCDPDPCTECGKSLGQKVVVCLGSKFHFSCSPTCFICGENDVFGMVHLGFSKYKHESCTLELCWLCLEPFRDKPYVTLGNHLVHQSCIGKCSRCSGMCIDPLTFPKVPITSQNMPPLSRRMKNLITSFIVATRITGTISRDVTGIIVRMMINTDQETSTNIALRHGVDFRKVCTPNRCVKTSQCKKCCRRLAFNSLDSLGCHQESCYDIRKCEQIVVMQCFKFSYEVLLLDPNYLHQPDNSRLKSVALPFISIARKTMTEKQMIIYSAHVSAMTALMNTNN